MALVIKRNGDPTLDQMQTDVITQLSVKYWAPFGNVPKSPFNAEIIELIYQEELIKTNFLTKRIMVLEFGQYLENYLWPNFTENASKAHIMSIIAVINEKCRERVQVWEKLQMPLGNFSTFFHKAMDLSIDEALTFDELCVVITFFINAFNNLGNELVRNEVVKVCNILMWTKIPEPKRKQIFKDFPRHKKAFLRYKKCLEVNPKGKKSKEEIQEDVDNEEEKKMLETRKKEVEIKLKEAEFLPKNIERFLSVLEQIQSEGSVNEKCISYCERFLEWMIDVESQLFTRKFFTVVLDSYQIVVKCRMSSLVKREKEGHLFRQLLDSFQFYCRFEIDDFTGEALSESDMMKIHSDKVISCQKVIFHNFPELRSLALSNVGRVSDRKSLMQHLSGLSNRRLHELAGKLYLISEPDELKPEEFTSEFLLEILIYHLEVRQSQLEMLNEMPLYPTENIIWDENVVPTQYHGGSSSSQATSSGLALPKLNLLFLTVHDYLLRNFNLFRLESTYEIRQDIEESVSRMKPYLGNDGACSFEGWSQMAQPIVSFNIMEVAKPNVGKKHPARVRANLTVNIKKTSKFGGKKHEWESLKKHDIVFLITLRPHNPEGCKFDFKKDFVSQVGLVHVRGCEIEGMLDENGKIIEEGLEQKPEFKGNDRTFRVTLDPNQYYQDMNKGSEDPYLSFNLVMRRRPKENNFKAVLETIRDLMNTKCVIPSWLHEKILGYKEKVEVKIQEIPTLDFKDTFLNFEHLKSSFPNHKVILKDSFEENEAKKSKIDSTEIMSSPPYKLTFCETKDGMSGDNEDTIIVEPYQQKVIGPYPVTYPKKNNVPFTKTQAEAILSGMQPGLTMIVGPPGTGKTDVAVQIISNLYHNFPKQRTLIVTHSNQALNQLFEKIMCLDIEERHMLRLGHGEEELETDKDYSRYGRVNYVLMQRMELLEKVQKLEASLGMASYQQHTCETAEFFFIQVLARYQEFEAKLKKLGNSDIEEISTHFPFHNFFADAPQPLFKKNSFEEDMNVAINCFEYIEQIFSQLKEFRPFELFRNGKDRVKYLLIKEARIIAMTCTHAALKRRDLVEAGFQYDNIIFEEAAQILEIETFVPLLLQNPEHGQSRLKRWIMIGDHHQLPPVIKNMAFQKFSNMEQSLFARFVNIGYHTVELDAQGRSRPSICNLFNWRYKNLGNLPHLTAQPEYLHANPGLYFDYQLIDVQDLEGVGESEPKPFFYQNLAEAEYICRFYMYLRLIGYPAEKIVILTTYNGQKHLIRDVCDGICKGNRLLGLPSKITTVDRYQGQQNDIVLLSLVRTKNVGHLRDVRRLVVAMSRARLGLYIFGRVELFRNCLELIPVFSQLLSRPLQLYLAPMETYKTVRPIDQFPNNPPLIIPDMEHMCNFINNFYQGKAQAFRKEYELQQQQQQLEAEAEIEEMEPDDIESDNVNTIIEELPIDPPDDNQQNKCNTIDKEEVDNL